MFRDLILFHPLATIVMMVVGLLFLNSPRRAIALLILSPFAPFLILRGIGTALIAVSEWAVADWPWTSTLMRAVDWLQIPERYTR